MRSFWIFWRRKHKVGQPRCEEDAHELCENDASCDADGRHRRFFLKPRSSGDGPRPATVRVDSSSSSDDDEDDEDEDEYEDEYDYEEEDDDECLTCNVCERSFPSARRLSRHQQRKRHFGCPVCDAIFLPHSPSRTTGEPWSTGRRTMTMKTHRSRIRGGSTVAGGEASTKTMTWTTKKTKKTRSPRRKTPTWTTSSRDPTRKSSSGSCDCCGRAPLTSKFHRAALGGAVPAPLMSPATEETRWRDER
ncbi:zinc finger Ran-binding domain-containing protein 2 [Rhipicephalus sanguineus]|uniref:zinc finger Ran-binding domain-containing protein 2 n=1 Tax=Rhipicephalus sanguineus TaxID=34632 RepID=UPI001892E313|nr:zinc finger Ran-binding domain-containing protein 2 [Rhipicephalus sanguineus]